MIIKSAMPQFTSWVNCMAIKGISNRPTLAAQLKKRRIFEKRCLLSYYYYRYVFSFPASFAISISWSIKAANFPVKFSLPRVTHRS